MFYIGGLFIGKVILYTRGLLTQTKNLNYSSTVSPFLAKKQPISTNLNLPQVTSTSDPYLNQKDVKFITLLYRTIESLTYLKASLPTS